MHIKNIYVRNWANLPDGHYEPGPLSLITGGSGSGKTTIIDAIQTVMTAARSGLFHFNPGQDETAQRSKKKQHRTLESYALGCDDGSYARIGTQDSIVGINYDPAPGEAGEPFSAMFVMQASLVGSKEMRQAKLDKYEMFIINGHHIDLHKHLKHPTENRWLLIDKELERQLKAIFRKDDSGKNNVEPFSGKDAYLCRLYAKFQGKKGSINSESMKQMVKSFVKFMAYRPFGDIDQLMRASVLEAVDNKDTISEISSMMKRIATMRREADHIDQAIVTVDKAKSINEEFTHRWLKRRENEAVLWRLKHHQKQQQYTEQKQYQIELKADIDKANSKLAIIEKKLGELDITRIDLRARCSGSKAYRQKEELLELIKEAEKEIREACTTIAVQSQLVDSARNAVREINHQIQNRGNSTWVKKILKFQSLFEQVGSYLEKADGLLKVLGGDGMPDLTEAYSTYQTLEELIERLIDDISNGGTPPLEELRNELTKKNIDIARSEGLKGDLKKAIDDLKTRSKVQYHQDTVKAVAEINRRFPDANPRVLGDQIEILDQEWQNAIEGFIAGARENILVSGEYEADARRIVRGISRRTRVVQGTKAIRDAKDRTLHQKSIARLMEISDEYARAYIEASFGNVQTVESLEGLKMVSRGITKEGDAVNSYTYFTAFTHDKDLVCGKEARKRRQAALEKDFDEQVFALQQLNDDAQEISALVNSLEKIKPVIISPSLQSISSSDEAIKQFNSDLDNIDLSETEELEERLNEVEGEIKTLNKDSGDIIERRGGDMAILYGQNRNQDKPDEKSIIKLVKRLSKEAEDFDEKADEYLVLYVDWRQEADREMDEESIIDYVTSLTNDGGTEQINELESSLSQSVGISRLITDLSKAVGLYNEIAVQQHYIENEFEHLVENQRIDDEVYFHSSLINANKLEILLNLLKNNVLVKQKDTLQRAQEKFDETFTMSLAQEILSQIERSKRTLDTLNKELAHHKFDDETFEFAWHENRAFSDYRKCFSELELIPPARAGNNISLFENTELSEETRATLSALRELLLQDDDAKALSELERMSDYRNYFNYEIYKKPEGKPPIPLSTYGTGSGGQLETPFYVIMAAAFQSAMGFQEGSSHLRTIIIDESFPKTDEKRSRRILQYLSGKLGLQIIFAMPTVKTGPFKSICTDQFVVQKVKDNNPPPGSELRDRVLIDSQILNHEAIEKLYKGYRNNVSQQASFEFLKLIEETQPETP